MAPGIETPWPAERARAWQAERGWRVGCNFTPSSACNQLEMWQEPTFDLATLERELGFAAGLGFTSVRVFLHDLLWSEDAEGLVQRLDAFLTLAAERGIGVMLVLFDGVWNPHPAAGPQPEPRPRVHNSCWVQGPGVEILGDPERHDALRPYVEGVIGRFREDPRVDAWDLFNEPDSPNPAYLDREIPDKAERALELLEKVHWWARGLAPAQPLTIGVWRGDWRDDDALSEIDRFSLEHSDVISFHHYGGLDDLEKRVDALRRYERPVLCTEFMARGLGSTFDPHLGWMHRQGVGGYCWGLVAGRIQTEYPWDSWWKRYDAPPEPWHHDVLHADGKPYDEGEVAAIRSLALPRRDPGGS
jgi:hypothetical protein